MKLKSVLNEFIATYFNRFITSRVFLGFSCGLPFLLRLTVLDLWLKDCNISNTMIGVFTLLHWPYAIKFLWAPFIERVNCPIFSKFLGNRRGWAFLSQLMLFCGFLGMAHSDPQSSIWSLMFFTSMVAFADGCQDLSLYAYQINEASKESFGPLAGVFVFGYRMGMFFSKSVTLYLAYYFNWKFAYIIMAFSIFICTIFILSVKEPESKFDDEKVEITNYQNFSYIIKNIISECLIEPFKIFMEKPDWKYIIAIIVLFMAGDRIAQKMVKMFYIDIGFSMLEIANVVQIFGTVASLIGGIIGGYLVKIFGNKKGLLFSGSMHAIASLGYIVLTQTGYNVKVLYYVVFIENITGGVMSTVFIAFLYSLCCKKYATTQYALLWAFYEIGGMFFRTISGGIADILGWRNFFILIPLTFIPSLWILQKMINQKRIQLQENHNNII